MRPEVLVAMEAVYRKGRIVATRCKTLSQCMNRVNASCRKMCESLHSRFTGIDPKICFIHCLAGASEVIYAPRGPWARDAAEILRSMANFRLKRVDSSLDFGEDYPCLFSIASNYRNLASKLRRFAMCYYMGVCAPKMVSLREMLARAASGEEAEMAEEIVEEVVDALLGVTGGEEENNGRVRQAPPDSTL